MTKKEEFMERFNKTFSQEEIKVLGGPSSTNSLMEAGDKVILKDEMLDYLCWFFDEYYDGKKLPQVFGKVLIEHICQKDTVMKYYVSFPADHPDWFFIDIFCNSKFLCKEIHFNRDFDDTDIDPQTGRFYSDYSILVRENSIWNMLPEKSQQKIASSAKNVVLYVFLYMYANLNNEEIVVVEQCSKKERKTETVQNKKGDPILKKVTRTIPYTRRIVKLNTDKPTPVAEQNAREYLLSRWKVRGYSYTRKDGKVINVKDHIATRHYPNKGVDKTLLGTNYILKEIPKP